MNAAPTNPGNARPVNVTDSLGLRRLVALYTLLGTPPARKIDLSAWRKNGDSDEVTNEQMRNNECGAVGCMIGFACASPIFNKDGLNWDVEHNVPQFWDVNERVPQGAKPWTSGSWSAVERCFQLSNGLARVLFSGPTTTEFRIYSDWSQRDIGRKRLWDHLFSHGVSIPEFTRIDK